MRKFLKYFITFLVGVFVGIGSLVLLVVIAIASLNSTKEPEQIKENSVLKIQLPPEITEKSDNDPFSDFFSQLSDNGQLSMSELRKIFSQAQNDNKIKGIILEPGLYSGGFANAEEIRSLIDSFRGKGKWVYSYGEAYSEVGYYIASACTKVYLNPKGMMEFNGLSSNVVMMKGLFDKMGIDFQVFKVGKFKGAVEPFTQTTLSVDNKNQILGYLNSLYKHQIEKIAVSRKKNKDSLWTQAMAGNIFTAKQSESAGLVDDLTYEDEFLNQLNTLAKDFNTVKTKNYLTAVGDGEYSEDKIAVLYVDGEIIVGKSSTNQEVGSVSLVKEIRKLKEDKTVKAIVLRVNSPGGSSLASDVIAREIELTKKVKPVIVSFGNVAASGGYYISCLADSIFASPNSITGSIGVFALIINTKNLYTEKLGLTYENVNLGTMTDMWRPDQPLNTAQSNMVQNMVEEIYDDFITVVSRGRKITKERVMEIAQGRVYSGQDALNIELIDGIGGLDRAILSAKRKAKISNARIEEYPKSTSPFEEFFNEEFNSSVSSAKILQEFGINASTANQLQKVKNYQGFQTRLPWSIEIH
jgi:protease-4